LQKPKDEEDAEDTEDIIVIIDSEEEEQQMTTGKMYPYQTKYDSYHHEFEDVFKVTDIRDYILQRCKKVFEERVNCRHIDGAIQVVDQDSKLLETFKFVLFASFLDFIYFN